MISKREKSLKLSSFIHIYQQLFNTFFKSNTKKEKKIEIEKNKHLIKSKAAIMLHATCTPIKLIFFSYILSNNFNSIAAKQTAKFNSFIYYNNNSNKKKTDYNNSEN